MCRPTPRPRPTGAPWPRPPGWDCPRTWSPGSPCPRRWVRPARRTSCAGTAGAARAGPIRVPIASSGTWPASTRRSSTPAATSIRCSAWTRRILVTDSADPATDTDTGATEPETGAEVPAYPQHWSADVLASDGRAVRLRPIVPSDGDKLVEFHSRLSERTRYLRYFGPYPTMSARDVRHFTEVDYSRRVALVMELGGEMIAVGRDEGL